MDDTAIDQTTQDDTPIVDADVVSEPEDTSTPATVNSDQSTVLLSLDEMIKLTVASLDRLKEEMAKARDMLNDALMQDANYKQHDDAVKAATKERTKAKKLILERPGMIEMAQKTKSLHDEIKEKESSLSDYAEEYSRLADVNQIELSDGEILEIIKSSKVVRKKK